MDVRSDELAVEVGAATANGAGAVNGAAGAVPGRRSRSRRRARAQAMVEFALVAPLFFTVLFGLLEYSLISASIGVVDFATKDAARIGSFLGRTDSTADAQMLNDLRSRAAGIVTAKITQVEIFKADAAGNMLSTGGCPCEDIYVPSGSASSTLGACTVSGGWTVTACNWPPNLRNDTLINADFLGVKVSYQYTYLTAFLAGGAANLQLTATSVQRIEPQDYQGWWRRAEPGGPPGGEPQGPPIVEAGPSDRRAGGAA